MVPFFVGSKGGKCAAFSFPTPIQTFPGGKGLVASCRSSEGACGSGVFFCSGGGVLWGTFWVRFSLRPLAGASRLGDMRVLRSLFFCTLQLYFLGLMCFL